MAKADETGSREAQKHVSMQASNFPKDLVQRFMNGNDQFADQEQSEEPEEIELSLGLSLNGRFGVDPTRANNKLTRSSSIPDFINPFVRDRNETSFMVAHMACANLIRTRSLPTETEEEWGKRKELQTLRRMEAKRKRSEKQRNVKIAKDRSWVSGEDDKWEEGDNGVNQMNNCGAIGVKSWVYGGAKAACCNVLKSGSVVEGGLLPPASQASIGSSLGSGSSGISDLESQPPQGSNKCTEAVSPLSVQSIPKNEDKPPRNPEVATTKKSGKSTKTPALETRVKMVRNVLEDMPCVTTTGDGPNGKRIEGFLYRYTKGEEVMIVCVCHGSFLSPAEFVKHAGGELRRSCWCSIHEASCWEENDCYSAHRVYLQRRFLCILEN